ncbi:hypothetical protein LTR53_010371 [Teratosphaeriaceae sp. CCFEE 6253]|nr:hypothetical protein LTR53_010371 [Teratosphaeriaceae sp. CCFEE 6253]
MAETKPTPPPRLATSSGSTITQSTGARQRLPPRDSLRSTLSPVQSAPDLPRRPPGSQNFPSQPPELLRRRSSLLSDATTFTEDLLNPSARHRRHTLREEEEVTHWHSTPLAFALLPALGGLLFKNGSAFTTDVLLLGLAAVFMNWSIRIPWDWYYTAQAVRKDVEVDGNRGLDEDDEIAVETASSSEGSPPQKPADSATADPHSSKREEAAARLRTQEILALCATVLFPALAAYLLHLIRSQLSRASTTLVSDYNLSIFLLAAEIRPARQLVRLITTRTLHLQRVVNSTDDISKPFAPGPTNNSSHSLNSRLADLEAQLTSTPSLLPAHTPLAQKTDIIELATELRKRYEPRLEGLERAVRRYEKRSTTLALLTEQRLNTLESRLQDALSLAAVAAQHSQRQRSVVSSVLEMAGNAIALPMKVVWRVVVWPWLVLEDVYDRIRVMMLGPAPVAAAGKRAGGKVGSEEERERARSKGGMKRVVR